MRFASVLIKYMSSSPNSMNSNFNVLIFLILDELVSHVITFHIWRVSHLAIFTVNVSRSHIIPVIYYWFICPSNHLLHLSSTEWIRFSAALSFPSTVIRDFCPPSDHLSLISLNPQITPTHTHTYLGVFPILDYSSFISDLTRRYLPILDDSSFISDFFAVTFCSHT